MLIELVTAEHPLNHIKWAYQLHQCIMDGTFVVKLPSKDKYSGKFLKSVTIVGELIELMGKCTSMQSNERPSFEDIHKDLKKLKKKFFAI